VRPTIRLIAIVCAIGGLFSLYIATDRRTQIQETSGWPAATATITKVWTESWTSGRKGSGGSTDYVKMDFVVAGQHHAAVEAFHISTRHRAGERVTIHYDPASPEYALIEGALQEDLSHHISFGIFLLVISAACVIWLLISSRTAAVDRKP